MKDTKEKADQIDKTKNDNTTDNMNVCKDECEENDVDADKRKDENNADLLSLTDHSLTDTAFTQKNKHTDSDKAERESASHSNIKEDLSECNAIDVQHECFGKAWGRLFPHLYGSPSSKCIKCIECCKYFKSLILII